MDEGSAPEYAQEVRYDAESACSAATDRSHLLNRTSTFIVKFLFQTTKISK